MRLDSIWDTEKGVNDYPKVKESLLKRFGVKSMYDIRLNNFCEDYSKDSGYGTHVYYGKLKDDVKVSELELAMICDNGYSFFGGSSVIDADKKFKVEIWFD